MILDDIVKNFKSTPFLFAGSGLTRRYYNLPDWETLLRIFASRINKDKFAYNFYQNKAKTLGFKTDLFPKIAELIEKDFNDIWFNDPSFRELDDKYLELVQSGVSPFKAEIAFYIKSNSVEDYKYKEEIKMLKDISVKSISGIITTNYDCFFENTFVDYKTYVGQEELISSSIQGIAEIYKIHGSIENPKSIVLNENDYIYFEQNAAYLAAKLMTLFMEYPIIFIGYSISDPNIQNILNAIISCLSENNISKFKDNFVFVEYMPNIKEIEISNHTIAYGTKYLEMTKIKLNDFSLLYKAISNKKAAIPTGVLRVLKKELYDYILTNSPTSRIKVASIDDSRINDNELAIVIGRVSDFGVKGLSGLSSAEWYRNVITPCLEFTADDLLQYAYPTLIKSNSYRLPIFKYLSEATMDYPEVEKLAQKIKFDSGDNQIISETLKHTRKYASEYKSVKNVWESEKNNLEKAILLISQLTEDKIDVDELYEVILKIFDTKPDCLDGKSQVLKTNMKRLIRIYDYFKYKK